MLTSSTCRECKGTPGIRLGAAIQPEVAEVAHQQEVLHHVQSPRHLTEQKHSVAYSKHALHVKMYIPISMKGFYMLSVSAKH